MINEEAIKVLEYMSTELAMEMRNRGFLEAIKAGLESLKKDTLDINALCLELYYAHTHPTEESGPMISTDDAIDIVLKYTGKEIDW